MDPDNWLTEDDALVLAEAVAWLRGLDLETAGPDTRVALSLVAEQHCAFENLKAAGGAPAALEFIFKLSAHLLISAQVVHESEAGTALVSPTRISDDDFRRRYIAPIQADARRVVRVIRRQSRPARARSIRPRARRRRTPARRAAGIRAGPDDDGPGSSEPPPRRHLTLAPRGQSA